MIELPEEMEATRQTSRDVQGINVNMEPAGIGVRLRRAGGWNYEFGEALGRETAPYRLALVGGVLTDETADRIMARAYGAAVVVGWWRLDPKGEPMPKVTPDAVEAWAKDHPKDFLDMVGVANTERYFLSYGEPGTVFETDPR